MATPLPTNDDPSSSSSLQLLPPAEVDGIDQSVMETSVDYTSRDIGAVQLELEKKLKCRADRLHLVQMNILPAVSTAPVILAQTHKLQRQKTADTLQQKLRDRLTRNDLYQRNILPDNKLMLDPSLSATQKMLQKRRMADNLNSKISNRPGALELVEGHILEPNLGKALETYLTNSDGSSSADPRSVLVTPSPTSSLGFHLNSNDSNHDHQHKYSDPSSPVLSPGDSTIMDDQKSPVMLFSPQGDVPTPPPPPPVLSASKSIKMSHHCKPVPSPNTRKRQHKPKYRKLRYHEYIPPSKNGAKGGKTNSVSKSTPANSDSPYSLLLQQQQLFLQLQVLQQQYPNGVLVQKLPELMKNVPASLTEKAQALLKPKTAGMENNNKVSIIKTHEIPEVIKVHNGNGGTVTVRLDELKVSALKSACKEQNLMVSGKKVELIERLLDNSSNGVLPACVLNDTGSKERRQSYMIHSISLESNNNSPQSPEPDSLFQFPGRTPGSSSGQTVAMETSSLNSPVVMGLVGQLQNCDIQQQVDKLIEKKKIDYLSANGPKTVAPKFDLSKLVAVARPQQLTETKLSSNYNKNSKSLPTTPQQLSPAGSTDNILHELMEQSPKPPPPHSVPLPGPHPPHSTSPDSIVYHNPPMSQTSVTQFNPNRRSGRTSLPNPPPYPGVGTIHNDPLTGAGTTGIRYTGSGYHPHLAAQQRSHSLSGPSSNKPHQHQPLASSALVAETSYGGMSGSGEPMAAFTNDDLCLNELMEMDTDFHDLFKILEKDEQVPSHSTHQSLSSFDQPSTTTSRMSIPHQDSAQSDSVMFGVPHHNTGTCIKSNSIDLMSSLEGDHKLNNTSNTNYSEFGTLNLDSALLGSSPHLQGYFPDSHTTTNNTHHQDPFDYLQGGQGGALADEMSYKPSSSTEFGSGLDVHQQLMEGGHFSAINGGGLFGSSDSTFLDLNLAS